MRLRVGVSTSAHAIPWKRVLEPGRAVCYTLLRAAAPVLADRLHEQGFGRHGMVPFGYSGPVFPQARKRRGVYAAGGRGYLELGSPLPEVVAAWSVALAGRDLLDWGGVALRVHGISLVETAVERGSARLRTRTPVVMKGSGRDDGGERSTRQAWVLPTEPEFHHYFEQNLRRKAESLDLAPDVSLEQISWVGPKRSFAVGDGLKLGASVEAELKGNPLVLNAIRDWGLGQANSAGFGWVAA
ncbi:CRISPR-associated endoribonuclease Cas6 [Nocardia sp. NPDC051570]|uniref:CRISPR-associated endoribonuclease Cas6 n=1 Tax=Nocardia sp. NPDC051570 TaxID=3364324 RepID=UPI0037B71BDC